MYQSCKVVDYTLSGGTFGATTIWGINEATFLLRTAFDKGKYPLIEKARAREHDEEQLRLTIQKPIRRLQNPDLGRRPRNLTQGTTASGSGQFGRIW